MKICMSCGKPVPNGEWVSARGIVVGSCCMKEDAKKAFGYKGAVKKNKGEKIKAKDKHDKQKI